MTIKLAALSRHLVPLVAVCVLIARLCGAAGAAALHFDGKRGASDFPSGKALDAADLGAISVTFSREAASENGATILLIRGLPTFIEVRYSEDNDSLVFAPLSGDGVTLGSGLKSRPDHALRLTLSREEWTVSIDGVKAGTLSADGFATQDDESLQVQAGSPGFVGDIGVEVSSSAGLPYASLLPSGAMLVRTVPQPGIYIRQDSATTLPVPLVRWNGDDVHYHGVFEKNTYYAVVATPDGVAIAVDWGAILRLTPDPGDPTRYIAKDPAERWAGAVVFQGTDRPDATPSFQVVNGHASTARPFLANGASYVRLPPRPEGEGEQQIGSVFSVNELPANMKTSMNACFNVNKMDLTNLTDTGCGNAFFALPPAKGGDYESAPPHIVPFGWRWYLDAFGAKDVFSTLSTSSTDDASAWSGARSSGFDLLGLTVATNEKSESEARSLSSNQQMKAVQQSFQRLHSLVVDPNLIYLEPCFTRRVLRAAAGIKARQLGINQGDLTDAQLPAGPDYYEPLKRLQACPEDIRIPYSSDNFLKDYGTHFAYAITYGGRSYRTSTLDQATAERMASQGVDLSRSIAFDYSGKADLGDTSVKGSVSNGASIGQRTATTTIQSFQVESSSVICLGGSKCHDDGPDGLERNPTPVFLDLVRMDHLLAPPYFTDLTVIQDLRQTVAARLDQALAVPPRSSAKAPRFVDVQLASRTCAISDFLRMLSAASPHDADGTSKAYAWLQALCGHVDQASVAAYAVSGDGAQRLPLILTPANPSGAASPSATGPSDDLPSVAAMIQCRGGQAPNCQKPTFRMAVPGSSGQSAAPAVGGFLGFRLFANAASAAERIASCGSSCELTLDFVEDLLGPTSPIPVCRRVPRALIIPQALMGTAVLCNIAKGYQIVGYSPRMSFSTQYLGFADAAAAPALLTGQMAVLDTDAAKESFNAFGNFLAGPLFKNQPSFAKFAPIIRAGYKPAFTATLSFALQDVSLPRALGYAPLSIPASPSEDLRLSSLEPAKYFPWLATDGLSDAGMFRRCEAVWSLGNCEKQVVIVVAKAAAQRR